MSDDKVEPVLCQRSRCLRTTQVYILHFPQYVTLRTRTTRKRQHVFTKCLYQPNRLLCCENSEHISFNTHRQRTLKTYNRRSLHLIEISVVVKWYTCVEIHLTALPSQWRYTRQSHGIQVTWGRRYIHHTFACHAGTWWNEGIDLLLTSTIQGMGYSCWHSDHFTPEGKTLDMPWIRGNVSLKGPIHPKGPHTLQWRTEGGFGVFNPPPPPRNSEDIGGVFDRTSKKTRRLDFLL